MKRGELHFKICKLLLVLLVLITLIFISLADDYNNPGDDDEWIGEGDDDDDDTDEDEEWVDEDSELTEEDDVFVDNDLPGHKLITDLRLYCYLDERSSDSEVSFVSRDYYEGRGFLFIEDETTTLEDEVDLEPFMMKEDSYYYDGSYTSWQIRSSLDLDPYDLREKAKVYRFEGESYGTSYWENGGCVPVIKVNHYVNHTNTDGIAKFSYHVGDGAFRRLTGDSIGKSYMNVFSSQGFDVIWDEDQDYCEAIGGAWLNDSLALVYNSNYGQYKCCGDDRIWLKNKALYEDELDPYILYDDYETLMSDYDDSLYCLYTVADLPEDNAYASLDYMLALDEEVYSGQYGYKCQDTGFSAYDSAMNLDNSYDEDVGTGYAARYDPYFLEGDGNEETDIGKWSDFDENNPYFCSYNYDGYVENYKWLDVNEAGELLRNADGEDLDNSNPQTSICELFLGGTWTGSHCCGNKYDYDDESYLNESFHDTTYLDSEYDNPACLQGEAVDNGEIGYFNTSEKNYSFFNVNGTLYSCGLTDEEISEVGNDYYTNSSFVSDSSKVDYCEVLNDQFLCAYENNTWHSISEDYASDILGYTSEKQAISSEAYWTEELGLNLTTECCFNNGCWNGTVCVDELSQYEYNDSTGDVTHYICSAGQWTDVEGRYDWFYNTDAETVGYCLDNNACICSSNEDDETFCSEEGTDLYVAGCTNVSNFFKDDHYCYESEWTSRTKLLAFQLMELAGSNDYTLYCDTYTNTLLNYEEIDNIPNYINSFCILDYADGRIMGVSLNPKDDDDMMYFDADDILFQGSAGLLDDIIDDDEVDNCDDAYLYSTTEENGVYYECESDTNEAWFNNVTKTLIYAKEGLSYSGTLTVADYSTYETFLNTYYGSSSGVLYDHIYAYEDSVENVVISSEPYLTFTDFDRLYISKQASFTIVGVEETRYDGETAKDNREFMAVVYDGLPLDCDLIEEAYDTDVYCNETTSTQTLVLERTVSGSEHWQDLTSKLRITS